jgi:hypothetical protein
MKRAMWKKLQIGTLVALPASNGQFLIGQILIPGMTFYMQVHSMWVQNISDYKSALESSILLFGETTDGELCREKWIIFGQSPTPISYYRPYHVVGTPDGLVLCDFDEKIIRQATSDDVARYGYKPSVSSSVFTTATNDYLQFGLKADFRRLDARVVVARCKL